MGSSLLTQEPQPSPIIAIHGNTSQVWRGLALGLTISLAVVWPSWTHRFPLHCGRSFGDSHGKLPSQHCLKLSLMLEALRSNPVDPSPPLLVRSGQTWTETQLRFLPGGDRGLGASISPSCPLG